MNNSTFPQISESIAAQPPHQSPVFLHITQFFYVLTFLIGSLGNISVIVSVVHNKRRIAKDYLILHLSMADLMLIFINIPFRFYHSLGEQFSPLLKVFFVKFVLPLMPFSVFLSVYTLVFIAFERHQTILHPLRERMSGIQTLVILISTWLFSALCVMPLIWVARFDGRNYEEVWPGESYRKAYTMGFFFFQYAFPLIVIIILYLKIALFLHHQKKLRRELTLQRGADGKDLQRQQNIRVYKMFTVIVLVFAVCNLPNHLLWLITEFSTSHNFQHLAMSILVMFADVLLTFNSCTNPVIYGLAGVLKLRFHGNFCFSCVDKSSPTNTSTVRSNTAFTRLSPVTSGMALEDIPNSRSNGTMISYASSTKE